jgi:hypothetical protein
MILLLGILSLFGGATLSIPALAQSQGYDVVYDSNGNKVVSPDFFDASMFIGMGDAQKPEHLRCDLWHHKWQPLNPTSNICLGRSHRRSRYQRFDGVDLRVRDDAVEQWDEHCQPLLELLLPAVMRKTGWKTSCHGC